MLYFEKSAEHGALTASELKDGLFAALKKLGSVKKVLVIPPDFTRFHSFAGLLTGFAEAYYGERLSDVLPAIGTHSPMTPLQIKTMFPGVPVSKFRQHDWRKDILTLGRVPASFVHHVTEGKLEYSWPAQVNKLLVQGNFDLILSIGQVVPHEVIGMANFNKNIFVGTGGAEGIHKSHFISAVYGLERIMGRIHNPVRAVLNYASEHFAHELPIVYVHTVVGHTPGDGLAVKGLFIGDDAECFEKAAELSLKVNVVMTDRPLNKVVVYLDPNEYKSTWLGNKSIYRTRMAIADGGHLIVLAPGVKQFGEDAQIDSLIRKYGYLTSSEILDLTRKNKDLQDNLAAAAHLIHGSSEHRFRITYCPGYLSKEEVERVGFEYENPQIMLRKYSPRELKEGFNILPDGEEIFYISNPALGLWVFKERFENG